MSKTLEETKQLSSLRGNNARSNGGSSSDATPEGGYGWTKGCTRCALPVCSKVSTTRCTAVLETFVSTGTVDTTGGSTEWTGEGRR